MSGMLYVVGTPIGNLKDITLRALEILKSVDRVVAEDTRVTKKLLDRYDIKKPLLSLHERSPHAHFSKVASLVEEGESVALVTDAGTPGISDPGSRIVRLVRERCGEKAIVSVPGVSALTAAISVSGIPADTFTFVGFLPHKKGRQKALDTLAASGGTVVLYESPHRIGRLLTELSSRTPDRTIVVARELTKLYEEIAVGTALQILARFENGDISGKGEFVVILGG